MHYTIITSPFDSTKSYWVIHGIRFDTSRELHKLRAHNMDVACYLFGNTTCRNRFLLQVSLNDCLQRIGSRPSTYYRSPWRLFLQIKMIDEGKVFVCHRRLGAATALRMIRFLTTLTTAYYTAMTGILSFKS